VPDLYSIAKKYIENMKNNPNSGHSHIFLKDLGLVCTSKGLRKILGHSGHLYMYDEHSLRKLFEYAGFKNIERMHYGKSHIENIELVEDKGRHEMSICLESVKK